MLFPPGPCGNNTIFVAGPPMPKAERPSAVGFSQNPSSLFYAARLPGHFLASDSRSIPPHGERAGFRQAGAESIPLFSIFDRVGHEILFDHQSHLEDDGIVKFPEIQAGQPLNFFQPVHQGIAVYKQLSGGLGKRSGCSQRTAES